MTPLIHPPSIALSPRGTFKAKISGGTLRSPTHSVFHPARGSHPKNGNNAITAESSKISDARPCRRQTTEQPT
ncbi:predicted protein [Coccidioides posadasii str. Silveira]|uniref:Predicted protein n=1 Tax=Coccidioides posadasii (strain RMSCC 757 / Silveira) TaxID=443226 RepID=E9CS40_COCPS|nr:predicted protein [Coccidioides posadasii str. Silveira]